MENKNVEDIHQLSKVAALYNMVMRKFGYNAKGILVTKKDKK